MALHNMPAHPSRKKLQRVFPILLQLVCDITHALSQLLLATKTTARHKIRIQKVGFMELLIDMYSGFTSIANTSELFDLALVRTLKSTDTGLWFRGHYART